MLIGGFFGNFNAVGHAGIVRINGNGSLDTTFNPGSGANSYVYTVRRQADGKVIIGGWFNQFNGVTRNYVARLNTNGSLDTTFVTNSGPNYIVNAAAIQPDGKIVIGGEFTAVDGVARNHIARLNSNGTLDTTFNPGTGTNDIVRTVAFQADGKILLGGYFTQVNGATTGHLARLNANGSRDTSFVANVNFTVHSVVSLAGNKTVVAGYFSQVNGVSRNNIARLNADGTLDTGFDPGTGPNNGVFAAAVQADGKVSIGGTFSSINGVTRNYIGRLNANGSVDTTFNPGSGANDFVNCLAVQSDGKLLIGGRFTAVNGTTRIRLARLIGSVQTQTAAEADFNGDGFTDYVLLNTSTRQSVIWYLRVNALIGGAYAPVLPAGWTIACVADMDRDGHPDYLLYNASTRQTVVWYLNDKTYVRAAFGPVLPTGWSLIAAVDFNNNGNRDYVLFNPTTRQTAIWYLNGTTYSSGALCPTLPAGWTLVEANDFNNDGKPDLVLVNASLRRTAVWYLNGATFTSAAFTPTLPAGWTLQGSADFNRDGKPDYLLVNGSTRQTALWYLNGAALSGTAFGPTLAAGYSLAAP